MEVGPGQGKVGPEGVSLIGPERSLIKVDYAYSSSDWLHLSRFNFVQSRDLR